MTQGNTGWTDEAEVNFEDVPDEMVNLPDAVYVFDVAKVTPKKTKAGVQALEVVLKAASVHPTSLGVVSEVPKGAKGLYETVAFDPNSLFNAKNLLKAFGIEFPKKINYEILTEIGEKILDSKQILAKTQTQAASGAYAAKARVSRYYNEDTLKAALESNESSAANDSGSTEAAAAPARTRRRQAA